MIYEDDLYEGDPEKWSRPLWKVEIAAAAGLSGETAQSLAEALEDFALSVFLHNSEATDGDCWSVTLTTLGQPDEAAIAARVESLGIEAKITAAPAEQKDWLRHVHENFPPVTAGKFFIYGSHYEGDAPKDLIPLKIDAATAFGSGEHETTKGCLLALEELKKTEDFKNGLDMGCGSGILAVGMVRLWPDIFVTAIDIDPESTVVTMRHAEMNGVEKSIAAETGDGYLAPLAKKNAPYDVIAANILAGPLIAMAPLLAKALKPGGYAVLSGLLARQAADVAAAHEKEGLALVKTWEIGAWQALVFRK